MKRLFGTAGIRGITNAAVTPELALRLARACAAWIDRHARRGGSIAVGHDTRYGAEMLARAAAAGFAAAGYNVLSLGCVPTGTFAMSIARGKLDGGLLVTGSHMPPDRNGLIFLLADGALAPFSVTDEIEAIMAAEPVPGVPPDAIGRFEEAPDPRPAYIAECMNAVDASLVRSRKFGVTIDPANGTACTVAPEFFRQLGCTVSLVNGAPGPVPGRPSEPRAGTVGDAIRMMVETSGDLGACFDVDADRVFFIDRGGAPLSEDVAGAIFARHELQRGDTCVVPVNSSGLIEHVCRDLGARLEYCEVGQPPTLAAIKSLGAAFSYEESGKYYFPRRFLWSDGLYAAARLLEIMARAGKTAGGLAAGFPRFHQAKRNVPADDIRKEQAMADVARKLASRLTEGRRRDVTVDGFKRLYEDNAWLLFRKSGTEPLIRVYSDAPSSERAEQLARDGEALLKECL